MPPKMKQTAKSKWFLKRVDSTVVLGYTLVATEKVVRSACVKTKHGLKFIKFMFAGEDHGINYRLEDFDSQQTPLSRELPIESVDAFIDYLKDFIDTTEEDDDNSPDYCLPTGGSDCSDGDEEENVGPEPKKRKLELREREKNRLKELGDTIPTHLYEEGEPATNFMKSISGKYVGHYMIAVSKLKEPGNEMRFRNLDHAFVQTLVADFEKEESLQLLVPIVGLLDGNFAEFNETTRDSYQVITLGGNHRREALQQVQRRASDQYKASQMRVLVYLYKDLTTNEALELSLRSQQATENVTKMSSKDTVHYLRRIALSDQEHLATLIAEDDAEIAICRLRKGFKLKYGNVVDGATTMDYFSILCTLREPLYAHYLQIADLYSKGETLNQKISVCEKNLATQYGQRYDLKASKFREIRGLRFVECEQLLRLVKEQKLDLDGMDRRAKEIKRKRKLQLGLMAYLHLPNWEQTVKKLGKPFMKDFAKLYSLDCPVNVQKYEKDPLWLKTVNDATLILRAENAPSVPVIDPKLVGSGDFCLQNTEVHILSDMKDCSKPFDLVLINCFNDEKLDQLSTCARELLAHNFARKGSHICIALLYPNLELAEKLKACMSGILPQFDEEAFIFAERSKPGKHRKLVITNNVLGRMLLCYYFEKDISPFPEDLMMGNIFSVQEIPEDAKLCANAKPSLPSSFYKQLLENFPMLMHILLVDLDIAAIAGCVEADHPKCLFYLETATQKESILSRQRKNIDFLKKKFENPSSIDEIIDNVSDTTDPSQEKPAESNPPEIVNVLNDPPDGDQNCAPLTGQQGSKGLALKKQNAKTKPTDLNFFGFKNPVQK